MGIKVRFDGLDVMAMVSHLNHVALGRRVINIYEGDTNDSFLFKLDHTGAATSTSTGGEDDKEKLMLYMESGIRFHGTQRQNNATVGGGGLNKPLAPFVFQLRKQLRGLRLEQVTQLGQGDRVVHFVFGMGAQRRALLLELYAKGNLVLCDANYTIMALLRSHQYQTNNNNNNTDKSNAAGAVQVQVGQVYPVTYAARNVVVTNDDNNNDTKQAEEEQDKESTEEDKQEEQPQGPLSVTASSSAEEWSAWATEQVQHQQATMQQQAATNSNNNNKKNSKKDKQAGQHINLKTLLLKPSCGISHYGPNFLEHCILKTAGWKPHVPLQNNNSDDNNDNNLPPIEEWQQFLQVLAEESAKLDANPKATTTSAEPPKGYILYSHKKKKSTTKNDDSNDNDDDNKQDAAITQANTIDGTSFFTDKVLEEFQPYLLLQQHQGRHVLEFGTFNEAVDTFYGHLEGQKRLLKAEAAEQAATTKLEKIRHDQQVRLQGLEVELARVQEQAQVVEWNADRVEAALTVINSALDSGMDWEQLEQLIQVEQKENHNPIALLIYELDLEQDSMVLELPTADCNEEDDDNEEEEEQPAEEEQHTNNKKKKKGKQQQNGKGGADAQAARKKKVKKNHVLVTISLKESAHGNASQLFAKYRAMKEKSQRTVEASTKALKAAEETAQRQLADAKQKTQQATNTTALGSNVKPPWFTKFHWFITSDNYLVLGGRDAHQNEVLVKKYLRPGDAYLHADVHGAASCILRAKRIRGPSKKGSSKKATQTLPLSEQALREAGNFTICRSSAWTSKMVTSAWWVESHQVSKTAPTGEYLKVGAFMIRGKKNFLPPTQLEMGIGVMFRLATPEGTLDPATYARHKNERRDFALMEILELQQEDDDDDDHDDDVAPVARGNNSRDEKVAAEEEEANTEKAATDEAEKQGPTTEEMPASASNLSTDEATGEENGTKSSQEQQNDDKEASASPKNSASEKESNPASEPSPAPSTEKKKKKGLSVKERKLIKKYGSLEEAERVLAEREKKEQEDNEKAKLLVPADSAEEEEDEPDDANNNQGSMKRGKRGKKKKAARKYADQDDEDRELAMLALQGGEKVKKANKDKRNVGPASEEQKQAAAETTALLVKDAAEFAEKLPEDIRSVLADCVTVQNKGDEEVVVRWDKFDADVLDQLISFEGPHEAKLKASKRLLFLKSTSRVDNFSASLAGILRTIKKYGYENLETDLDTKANGKGSDGAKRKTKEEKKAESAEWKETLAEEGVVAEDGEEDEDADIDDTAENNKLTGKPHPEDALVYALPVCAPYQTLSQYTYRIKLTPGNMKRGKAGKQCVDMFLKGDIGGIAGKNTPSAIAEVCKDLIKKVGDNDWIQSLCPDVKISSAGASKATKKQKANNKAKARKKK
ncbi:export mediator factor NEMF [Seminavis robusta]|uniref:Export mediator factor NEMF n=1 Tax=Seminavis robusta TaxID=568900 RepID=A0A9N8HKD0_9STRA|nr:export mediator factor NEMF [Seminavis robusta]|eukprot:Sro748_g196640.1 export mediator factor NEMF (1395) ;mRNA; r:10675-14859